MTRKVKTYHHGDLRAALINQAIKEIGDKGENSLSLRKLARTIGVSHNAPYMHFLDKDDLFAAISQEGFFRLKERLVAIDKESAEDWPNKFVVAAMEYLDFSMTNPGLIRVMFHGHDIDRFPDRHQAGQEALLVVYKLVKEGQDKGYLKQGKVEEIAIVYWSLIHGISTLLEGRRTPLPALDGLPQDDLIKMMVTHLLNGIANDV